MKIKYNILWVEDNKSWYNSTVDVFRDTLEGYGFELYSDREDSYQQIIFLIEENGLQKYDMLLVDFTLKNSETGDKIIKLIRNNKIYTDVIFYSSAVENIKDSIREHGLEGVYTTNRDDIEKKFTDIFLTTIKKIQEINTMRGLIMGETSELDVEIENLVMLIVEKKGIEEEELKNIVTKKVFKKLREREEKFWDNYQDFNSYFPKIDAIKKWEILRVLFKSYKSESDDAICILLEKNKTYQNEVIEIRNMFAHVKEVEENGKSKLRGINEKKDIVFDDKKCVEIRQNLIKHRKCLEDIKELISNN